MTDDVGNLTCGQQVPRIRRVSAVSSRGDVLRKCGGSNCSGAARSPELSHIWPFRQKQQQQQQDGRRTQQAALTGLGMGVGEFNLGLGSMPSAAEAET